jgi:hypothetical protein
MSAIFDPKQLAAVREQSLAELEAELLTFSRTAAEPVERVVQAELAEEVRQLRARWAERGLLNREGLAA